MQAPRTPLGLRGALNCLGAGGVGMAVLLLAVDPGWLAWNGKAGWVLFLSVIRDACYWLAGSGGLGLLLIGLVENQPPPDGR